MTKNSADEKLRLWIFKRWTDWLLVFGLLYVFAACPIWGLQVEISYVVFTCTVVTLLIWRVSSKK